MLHVLGLQAPFPPPESVLGPTSVASADFAPASPVAAVAASSDSSDSNALDDSRSFNTYRAQCWAFAGNAGRFTVHFTQG
jgi:hypothetical protein